MAETNPFRGNRAKVLPPSALIDASTKSQALSNDIDTKPEPIGRIPPPPSGPDRPASNGGHGADDALRVTQILEEHGIVCCLVGISALIFYGAARVRSNWEICVPTHLVEDAMRLLQSEPYSSDYCVLEPWPYWNPSLLHTYKRFKSKDTDFHFVLVPSRDVHMDCDPSHITRSLRGLPYPKLAVFLQSTLDMRNLAQLVDAVDGMDLSGEWGEDNLQLDGTNDVAWAHDLNERGNKVPGNFLPGASFVPTGRHDRRKMWQEAVRTKKDRLDWTKPKHIFVTQHRLIGDPDPCTVLSDMY